MSQGQFMWQTHTSQYGKRDITYSYQIYRLIFNKDVKSADANIFILIKRLKLLSLVAIVICSSWLLSSKWKNFKNIKYLVVYLFNIFRIYITFFNFKVFTISSQCIIFKFFIFTFLIFLTLLLFNFHNENVKIIADCLFIIIKFNLVS